MKVYHWLCLIFVLTLHHWATEQREVAASVKVGNLSIHLHMYTHAHVVVALSLLGLLQSTCLVPRPAARCTTCTHVQGLP